MIGIEELYCLSDGEPESKELSQAYRKISDELNKLVDKESAAKIDLMYMDCVYMEKVRSFKDGFRWATALWKEC